MVVFDDKPSVVSGCGETYLTMLSSLLSSLRSEISRIDVEGTPSSSASRRIFLSATKLPDWRSTAL